MALVNNKLVYGSHGASSLGLANSSIHRAWVNMRQRCLNIKHPQYKDYGGRGITICNSWNTFEQFFNDMQPKLPGTSLERKNNNLGYFKENCYWANKASQQQNRRSAKLTKEQAELIRQSTLSAKVLAGQFGISTAMIGLIKRGAAWK